MTQYEITACLHAVDAGQAIPAASERKLLAWGYLTANGRRNVVSSAGWDYLSFRS